MAITNNGVLQWKFQRLANILSVVAGIAVVCILFCKGANNYVELQIAFSSMGLKVFLALALVVATLNSVLAGWQIAGDYAPKINMPVMIPVAIIALISAIYAVYGLSLIF